MVKPKKTPVTARAVIQRINRKLKADLQALKISRTEKARLDCGDYFILDYRKNYLIEHDVDIEAKARELGVLRPWEAVANE
jgi:hypothetical protein